MPTIGPAPKRRPSYADLFPPCRDCGDLCDGRDGRCDRCASEHEWQLKRQGAEIARQQIAAGMQPFTLNPIEE